MEHDRELSPGEAVEALRRAVACRDSCRDGRRHRPLRRQVLVKG